MPLTNLFKKIEAIETFDVEQETINIINEYGWFITSLLRLQLQKGRDANDEPVRIFGRDHYADSTIFYKEHKIGSALSKQTEWVTNYDHGYFYSSLKTVAEGRIFRTESDVLYFEEILRRSGDVIIKLSKEHLSQFAEEILIPQLKIRFQERL